MTLKPSLVLWASVLLAGCAAETTAEDPNVVIVDAVYFQLTGNDGAAFGQVGFGEVTEQGDIYCALNSPARLGGTAPTPHTFRGTDPMMFAALRDLVLRHGQATETTVSGDGIFYVPTSGETIAILPSADFDGHASELGLALIAIVNDGGRPCLPYG